MAQEANRAGVPRKAVPSPAPRQDSVVDAIDALESRRRRKAAAPARAAPRKPSDVLDLDSIR